MLTLLASIATSTVVTVSVPPYWTGTYNLASGSVVGGWFVEANLWIQGTQVDHKVFEEPLPQHVTLSVVVDSTHFAPGSSVQVLFEAKLSNGNWVSASETVPIINNAWAWEYPDFALTRAGHSSGIVQSLLSQAGWSCGEESQAQWTPANVRAVMAGQGVHYVNSHGNEYLHWSGHAVQTPGGMETLDVYGQNNANPLASYLHMRRDHVGDYDANPLMLPPPFNPSGIPQMSFAFIDACNSGQGTAFYTLLYPYRIYYDPIGVAMNQAVLCWGGYSSIAKAARMNAELWSRLRDGMTIKAARADMIFVNDELEDEDAWLIYSVTTDPNNWVKVTLPEHLPILGDAFARVHGVYTGSDAVAPNGWYL